MDLANYLKRTLAIAQAGKVYGKDVYDQERYCELEKITFDMLSSISGQDQRFVQNFFAEEKGYPTPKVDVRAFIRHESSVLLVQDKKSKEWSLPGGYAEVGFSPKENIIKEVKEETGLLVKVETLSQLIDTDKMNDGNKPIQYYKLIFTCSVVSGTIHQTDDLGEISKVDFFSIHELPKLSTRRTTKEQLLSLMKNNHNLKLD